jgi:Cu2+-exporting ATPase
VPGQGIEALVDGVRTRIGSPRFAGELWNLPAPELLSLVSDEVTTVALADENGWIALVTLDDAPRRDARALVHDLQSQGKTVCMLSGDRDARVQQLARTLGIRIAYGDATPQRKVDIVRALQDAGAVVAMIGDGVNDAPVLARAQVSVAMANGADIARSAADIVLIGAKLGALRTARRHACDTLRVVRQNLVWATLYNAVALPLAAAGLVTPLAAAAGMSISSLAVVLNALRLLRTSTRG